MARDLDNFRVLLVLAIATMGLAIYVNFIAPEPPRDLQEMLLWRGYGAVTPGFIAYYWHWVEFGLYAVALVSMFFFWRFARHLMIVALVVSPLRVGLGGVWVSAPLEDAFWALHWIFVLLATGMALFHPPVRAAFSSRSAVRAEEGQ